jgi:hypothetical protein
VVDREIPDEVGVAEDDSGADEESSVELEELPLSDVDNDVSEAVVALVPSVIVDSVYEGV